MARCVTMEEQRQEWLDSLYPKPRCYCRTTVLRTKINGIPNGIDEIRFCYKCGDFTVKFPSYIKDYNKKIKINKIVKEYLMPLIQRVNK